MTTFVLSVTVRRPPNAKRSDTLVPDTTLFRCHEAHLPPWPRPPLWPQDATHRRHQRHLFLSRGLLGGLPTATARHTFIAGFHLCPILDRKSTRLKPSH